MATRTISNTGGNYNATGTWVEGIVPTSADDVVATATSGPLTINVSSAARSIDLTTYTGLLNLQSTWTISGSAVTNTFGSSMTFNTTINLTARIVFSAACTLVQNNTNRIPGLRMTNNVTKTLSTDIYCVHCETAGQGAVNGNIIYTNGNFGSETSLGVATFLGTTKYVLDGSGVISAGIRSNIIEINTTGTYSTNYVGMSFVGDNTSVPELNIINGNLVSSFNIILWKAAINQENYKITTSLKIPNIAIYSNMANGTTTRNMNIILGNNLHVENLYTWVNNRTGTSDSFSTRINIYGAGLSASTLSLFPTARIGSSTTIFELTYKGPDIRLNSDSTHNIGSLMAIGGLVNNMPTISSITASLPCMLNLNNKETSQIINYNFTDIDASNGMEIVAINGTFSNCTNITSVYPSGGTQSGGGAWTFIN